MRRHRPSRYRGHATRQRCSDPLAEKRTSGQGHQTFTIIGGLIAWVASSGVVQGVIIGATLAFLTTILILDAVARAETRTVNGWSSIRRVGQPANGQLVRAALQKALPVVNVFEEAAYWTTSVDGAGKKLSGEHIYRLRFPLANFRRTTPSGRSRRRTLSATS